MSDPVDLTRVTFIVLREMRRPLMTLLIVYALSILGMTMVPGPVIEGNVSHMSIFHAFYFMSYTATTTGFGEIPFAFSNAQRLWAIICLYTSTIAWIYAIGSIIRLFQNPFFVAALAEWDFSKKVRSIPGEFIIICGFGDTGSVLARGLSDSGLPAVIIDSSEERIQALQLRNYLVPMPGLCADASIPKHLLEAGLRNPNCKTIVAITNDEETNLRISAVARLLNPGIVIITLSKVDQYEERLSTMGGEVHIVDPFKTFARFLSAAISFPQFYVLNNWLSQQKGATLEHMLLPPTGKWIICGYGRLGHEVQSALTKQNIEISIVDSHEPLENEKIDSYIVGPTNALTLKVAGIESADGILAGTDDDGQNLSILLNARGFNRKLFTIVRQNKHQNEIAFNASDVDVIMQPTLVTARKILFILIAPLLKPFFKYLVQGGPEKTMLLEDLIDRLRQSVGNHKPYLVTVSLTQQNAVSVYRAVQDGCEVLLGDIIKDPRNREKNLEMVVFVVKSGEDTHVLPDDQLKLAIGDQILFCGTRLAKRLFYATLNNEYKLFYIQNGCYKPRSYLAQWFVRKTNRVGI